MRHTPRAALLTLLCAPALAAAGCGESDQEAVRATLDRFVTASAEGDYQALCDDLLAAELVDGLRSVGLPCEVALRTGLSQTEQPSLRVLDVDVEGDQALARVRTDAANQPPSEDSIRLVQEDGEWRIASLARAQPQPPQEPVP